MSSFYQFKKRTTGHWSWGKQSLVGLAYRTFRVGDVAKESLGRTDMSDVASRRRVGLKRPIIFTSSGLCLASLVMFLTTVQLFNGVRTVPLQECGKRVSQQYEVSLRDRMYLALHEYSTAIDTRNQLVVLTDNPWSILDMPNERRTELLSALHANLKAPHIAQVHLLGKAFPSDALRLEAIPQAKQKLFTYDLDSRMTFFTAIEYANRCLPPGTTFVIANADIILAHESARLLPRFLIPNAVVALTRHNLNERGEGVLHSDPSASQDVWSMRAPFHVTQELDVPLGYLGSDNRVAFLLDNMQASLHNWCTDVIVWHHHLSNIRGDKERLPEPYRFVDVSRPRLSWFDFDVVGTPLEQAGSARSINVLRMDLPRMTHREAWTSKRDSLQFPSPWTEDALTVALARLEEASTRKKIQDSAGTDNRVNHDKDQSRSFNPLRSTGPVLFFLDISWDAWMHESYEWKWMFFPSKIYSSVPTFKVDSTLVLVPLDVGRFLCQTDWSTMLIGIHNDDGSFREFIDCEKRAVRNPVTSTPETEKSMTAQEVNMERRRRRRRDHSRKRGKTLDE